MRLNAHCPILVSAVTLLSSLAGHAQLHPEATSKPEQNFPSKPAQPAPKPGEVWENPKDGLKYVWIPPGTFLMGCSPGDNECDDEEKPVHQVTLTKGFWMGQTEVTVGAYKRFAAATERQLPPPIDLNPGWANQDMPMIGVTWSESRDYCQWARGRLPTEAEWEYAARGGSPEARYGPLDDVAWYANNSSRQHMDIDKMLKQHDADYVLQRLEDNGGAPHPVGQKRANGFGLYDVLGNASEWVNDWHGYYQSGPLTDPQGPTHGTFRDLRGGAWLKVSSLVRVSARGWEDPTGRLASLGLRCAADAAVTP